MHIILAGNPNCGKTTLFNILTGENQRVGNWPGVTVEKKTGYCTTSSISVTDLPGIYSLSNHSDDIAIDEQIASKTLMESTFDCVINIVNACHLERHMYLTSQIIELKKPMILVLNMMDLARKQGIVIDTDALSSQLGCPVIELQANTGAGIENFYNALKNVVQIPHPLNVSLSEKMQNILAEVGQSLENEEEKPELIQFKSYRKLESGKADLASTDWDILFADARYQAVHEIVQSVQTQKNAMHEQITARIDRILLHRFFALPIFLGIMYVMFLFAINIGGAFQDFLDISTDTIFVKGTAFLLQQIHTPEWIIALIANGIGKGINTTLTFVPVIAAMFFFLAFLETSGYMARAAFVVDRAMRLLGLPGKSFVPMIVGFGCNVPAIMAARSLDSERDRLLTVLMSPFMSCSARLAIYAVFVAAFFPVGGQNIVFSLYLFGILMAVLTGFLLKKTLLKGNALPLILELPAYHVPSLKRLLKETGLRLKHFVWRAGRLIVPVCVLLGGLNALTVGGTVSMGEANAQSILSVIGQTLTPLFSPMGLTQENWPATVGLLTGMLAKEVVVGSLNALYVDTGSLIAQNFDFLQGMKEAFLSIPQNLAGLGSAFFNPVLSSAPTDVGSQSMYGAMVQRFDGKAGAFAYLLFILLYIPCVSTMAVIRQESSSKWMWVSIIWSMVVAYGCAVIFYQVARFFEHPQMSFIWIAGLIGFVAMGIYLLHRFSKGMGEYHAASAS